MRGPRSIVSWQQARLIATPQDQGKIRLVVRRGGTEG
jgi:hypothetical protein